jgi:hypothetical protein
MAAAAAAIWCPLDTLRTECRGLRDRVSTLSREYEDATTVNARLARELSSLRHEVEGLKESHRELGVRTKVRPCPCDRSVPEAH